MCLSNLNFFYLIFHRISVLEQRNIVNCVFPSISFIQEEFLSCRNAILIQSDFYLFFHQCIIWVSPCLFDMQTACFSKVSDIKACIPSLDQNFFSVYLSIHWCCYGLLIFTCHSVYQFCLCDFECSVCNLNSDLYISCIHVSYW